MNVQDIKRILNAVNKKKKIRADARQIGIELERINRAEGLKRVKTMKDDL
jgi:hypothetical protein